MLKTMSEIINNTNPGTPTPDRPPVDEASYANPGVYEGWEAAAALREAQEGWLERRGMLTDVPRLTMARREFELLRNVGLGAGGVLSSWLSSKTKTNYGIPVDAQYVSIDIAPDETSSDSDVVHTRKLVVVHDDDFGTAVDQEQLNIPEDIPQLTMSEREYRLFGIVGIGHSDTSHMIQYAREVCKIPQGDQYGARYALVEIESGDPNLPPTPLLVDVTEADFGTVIEPEYVEMDNFYLSKEPSPGNPTAPESASAHFTVDIKKDGTLARSQEGLKSFAAELMKGRTTDPFSGINGDMRVRAGGIATGQKDAFVWENGRPFASAVELTIAFPGQYNSVCVVAGDRMDPINGKAGMAQIVARAGEAQVSVVLTIDGDSLKRLQDVYRDLYRVPDFALTESQRSERDIEFGRLVNLISEAAAANKAAEAVLQNRNSVLRPRQTQLKAKLLPIPGSDLQGRHR